MPRDSTKGWETIVLTSDNRDRTLNAQKNAQNVPGTTSDKGECKSVTLNNQEEWKKFFESQNNPSTNTTNKLIPKPNVHKDGGVNRYTARDENRYRGKEIKGKISEQIKEEISQSLKSNVIKPMMLKESKLCSSDKVYPTVRVALNMNEEINLTNVLDGNKCKECCVKSVTLMIPINDQDERGIRLTTDEDGTRIYEVANGSYDMTLNWYVEGKECKTKINISDDGSVKLINSNGVTKEQLAAYKEVKVGRQYEAKPLYEALYLKQENSEEVSQQPLTNIGSVSTPQKLSSTQGVSK